MAKAAESGMTAKNSSSKSKKQWIIENVTSLGLALFLVFTVRSSIIEAFKIPSGSMIPTLLVGDHIFVNKLSYGLKVPFTEWFLESPLYLIKGKPPQRGDIIVFKYPKDESLYYIKRVIGTPGDVLEVKNKDLYVNGQLIPRKPVTKDRFNEVMKLLEDSSYAKPSLEVFEEKLGNHDATIMLDNGSYMPTNFGPVTVPSESYFVMGDNRDASNDSRYWGFVPMRNIRGRAVVIWLSTWINLESKQFTFRPARIGTILH